ncbi:hypothetical protein [Arthrobacter sp. 162MFSha1.1]|uniref:hypothetical protein n=1 Tax=Arthrobacter sp. 162MFSha1.1 TaxID=1151119 RepID=UPI00037CE828|nr:hypothetical protein [Arthrobacter sp. 162MFSha1.1]
MKTFRSTRISWAAAAYGPTVLSLVAAMVLTGFTASSTAVVPTAVSAEAVQEASHNALAAVTPRPAQVLPSRPAPGLIEASKPLGAPAPLTEPSTEYSFMQTNPDSSPVTWDPCRPIHYVTRAANQPADGPEVIKTAIAAVSKATGIVFIDDGATTEAPGFKRLNYQPARYGDRWAPVLITWAAPGENKQFDGSPALAFGGSNPAWMDESAANYVSGEVDLNAGALSNSRFNKTPFKVAVLEHELGHVMGLAHHEGQLMAAVAKDQEYGYQAGDLAGLAVLGQGKCLGI